MPEKALELGYAGMASMEGTGRTGSCDSVASITSNHSVLSDESYDYLSAEERDVLMYLEKTIDSLDADSGLSTDDSERVEETPKNIDPKPTSTSETKVLESPGKLIGEKNGKNSYKGSSRILDETPKPNYNSLPKNLMIPRVELVKNAPVPILTNVPTPPAFENFSTPEKPVRKSLANRKEEGTSISKVGLILPPELFRDPDPVVRHASFKRDSLYIRNEFSKFNDVDGTKLDEKPGITLEEHLNLVVSPITSVTMKTKGDYTVAPLQQLSPTPPISEGSNELTRKVVDSASSQMQPPVQALPALATDREPVKKIEDPTLAQKDQPAHVSPDYVFDRDPLMKYGEFKRAPIEHPAQATSGLIGDTVLNLTKRSQEHSHAPIGLTGQVPAPVTGNSEPPKKMVVLRPLWKQTSLEYPGLQGTTEAKKESDAAKSPTRKTYQELQALPVNDERARASVDLKPSSQLPTQATLDSQFPNRDVAQSRRHAAVQPIPTPVEQVNKDADQNNVLLLSQDHRRKSASQETLQNQAGKTADTSFKQGPKTQPKPKLPPHIIVKPTYVSNRLEPQQRIRTQSLINVPFPNRDKSTSVKSHIIKDQLTPRQEALEKLKLSQSKINLQSESSVQPAAAVVVSKKEEIPVPHTDIPKSVNIVKPEDDQNNMKVRLQEKSNIGSNQAKPSVGMWSRQFPAAQEKAVPVSNSPPKPSFVLKSNEIQIPQPTKENLYNHSRVEDDPTSPKSPWQDKVKTFSVSPEKVYGGLRSREFPSRQDEMEFGKENPLKNGGVEVERSIPKSRWEDKSSVSTSIPEKVSVTLKQSDISPSDHSMERESVANKIKILSSSQIDLSSGQGLRLPQGSVPGLREVSFKSNTLERSGIGLSGAKQDGDDPKPNGGSNSFFKKLSPSNFHSNFSKKSKPRPMSMGTAEEFIAIQEGGPVPGGTSEPAKSETRRSAPFSLFPPKSRPASLISVKITPKNTADEHREALKKLGLLHE